MSQVPSPGAVAYPVTLDLDPADVKRWSPLVNWLLAIPHFFVLIALTIVWWFVLVISFFSILFTKNIPDGLFRFGVMIMRYTWRVQSYVLFLRSAYPPFEFPNDPADPGTDPAKLSIEKPAEYKRFLPLVKWLLAIPHYFVLWLLAIVMYVVWIVAFFAVIFTGRWPDGLRTFTIGYVRWQTRVNAYIDLLVDEYPPFSLE